MARMNQPAPAIGRNAKRSPTTTASTNRTISTTRRSILSEKRPTGHCAIAPAAVTMPMKRAASRGDSAERPERAVGNAGGGDADEADRRDAVERERAEAHHCDWNGLHLLGKG